MRAKRAGSLERRRGYTVVFVPKDLLLFHNEQQREYWMNSDGKLVYKEATAPG